MLKNNHELDRIVLCAQCGLNNAKVDIEQHMSAHCRQCQHFLYQNRTLTLEQGLALSLCGLLVFFIANTFPLISIEILGNNQKMTLLSVIYSLFSHDFYLVGAITALLIYIVPLLLMLVLFAIFVLFRFAKAKAVRKWLLIVFAKILPWDMSEIFLVSMLVALVKLLSYAQIEIGISFVALAVFVTIHLYFKKTIHLDKLWIMHSKL